MTHSGQSEQAIKALENNAASIAKQYIINGCYVGCIDRAVAIHVTSVKMSHVAVEEVVVECRHIGGTHCTIAVNIAHDCDVLLVGIQAHIHCLPVIVGVQSWIKHCNIEKSILLPMPAPVNVHQAVFVIAVDDEIVPTKYSQLDVDVARRVENGATVAELCVDHLHPLWLGVT